MTTAQMAYTKAASLTVRAERRFSRKLLNEINESLSNLHRHLSCVVCCQLLTDPFRPIGRECGHYVCRLCIRGNKRLYPMCLKCNDCYDFKTYEETREITLVLLCYKTLCIHIASNSLFCQLDRYRPYPNRDFSNPSIRLPRMSTQNLIIEGSNYDDTMFSFLIDTKLPLINRRNRSWIPPTTSHLQVDSQFIDERRPCDRFHMISEAQRMSWQYRKSSATDLFCCIRSMRENQPINRNLYNHSQSPKVKDSSTQTQETTNFSQSSAVTQKAIKTATKQVQTSPVIQEVIKTATKKIQTLEVMQLASVGITNKIHSSGVMWKEIKTVRKHKRKTKKVTKEFQSLAVMQKETTESTRQRQSLTVLQKETTGSTQQLQSTAVMQNEATAIANLNMAVKQKQTMNVNENPAVAVQIGEKGAEVPWKLDEILLSNQEKKNDTEIPLRSQKPIIVSSVQVKPPDKHVTFDTVVNHFPPVLSSEESSFHIAIQTTVAKNRKHCRCGVFLGKGTLKTCRNNRCFCYINGNSCSDCGCQGCKNPHKQDYIDTDEEDVEGEPKEKKKRNSTGDPKTTSTKTSDPFLNGLILIAINDAEQSDHPLVLVQNENNEMQCFNVFKDGVPINPEDVGFQCVQLQASDPKYSGIPKYAYIACPTLNSKPEDSDSQSIPK